jgi:hypothetical protein
MRTMLALAVVATLPLVNAQAQSQQPPPQQSQQIRFARMDSNADGVITRAEWRGTAQGFYDADWNGDGILSGVELQPGERYHRQSATEAAAAKENVRPATVIPARSAR